MWIYLVVLGVIWIGLLIPVVQLRRAWIVYAHGGSGLLFTSLLLSLALPHTGDFADIAWLRIVGYVLLVPAVIPVILIAPAMAAAEKGELVRTGILGVVRHPMYLGFVIAAFALILVFQSVLATALSALAIALLWMASQKEDAYNIELFGDSYKEYMARVSGWNLFKALRRR